jgi:hypothetical protein
MCYFRPMCAEMPVALKPTEFDDSAYAQINGSDKDMDRLPRLRALAKTRA